MKTKFITLIFLLLSVLSGCNDSSREKTIYENVLYSEIRQTSLRVSSHLPGRVSPSVISEVRPQVSGIITERLFEEGSYVKKGQPLYQIDPAIYQATFNKVKAEVAEAQARLVMLDQQRKRKRKLAGAKAVSQQDLENIISESAQAEAQLAKAKADLDMAAINLAYTTIKAPVAGKIGTSSITPGALVTINQSEPLTTIQQTEKVYVDITQSSADILRLQRDIASGKLAVKGNAAKVELLLEDGTPYSLLDRKGIKNRDAKIIGTLLVSDITVHPRTGSVNLRAIFENPEGLLLPGMYVTAILEHGTYEETLLVSQRSVMASGNKGHKVFVLRPDSRHPNEFMVEEREIAVGGSYDKDWIVKSGLEAGEKIVVEGLQKIAAGDSVTGKEYEASENAAIWKNGKNI